MPQKVMKIRKIACYVSDRDCARFMQDLIVDVFESSFEKISENFFVAKQIFLV